MEGRLLMETIELSTEDPMELFKIWFNEAKSNEENKQPEQMTLATIGEDGGPSARTVLLRGFDGSGFKMYWNTFSVKSAEIERNNKASLVYVWSYRTPEGVLGFRQVRVQGTVEELPRTEVEAYFDSEPTIAKIRATVQIQSRVITEEEREEIRDKCQKLWDDVQSGNLNLKCPAAYGGFSLQPQTIEFYQGLRDTINDRVRFRKGSSGWIYERLEC